MPTPGPLEVIILLVVVLLLFGANRLPKLARSMGEASREFKKGISEKDKADAGTGALPATGAPADEKVTLSRAELDALLAEREAKGREEAPPAS